MDMHIFIMELLDKLKTKIIYYEKNAQYDIWGGCYTSYEYDFNVRHTLSKEFPETSWKNPEHENMLVDLAIDSHAPRWKPEYLEGGWTKEIFILDGLRDLFIYYKVWENIK